MLALALVLPCEAVVVVYNALAQPCFCVLLTRRKDHLYGSLVDGEYLFPCTVTGVETQVQAGRLKQSVGRLESIEPTRRQMQNGGDSNLTLGISFKKQKRKERKKQV